MQEIYMKVEAVKDIYKIILTRYKEFQTELKAHKIVNKMKMIMSITKKMIMKRKRKKKSQTCWVGAKVATLLIITK